ncbi:MAG: hypothetical protein HY619_07850, partial [Thaumarchaeota archaeon]|nr:hypothetical protein [Nitrososphaerota archaeon]
MPQLAKKMPYEGTTISSAQSKVDIEAMLKEFGAEALRWTETPESMKGLDCPILEFVVKTEIKGVEKHIGFRIKPPLLVQRKRQYGRSGSMIETPALNQSMRLLWWWLKAKMEGVRFGLESIEET